MSWPINTPEKHKEWEVRGSVHPGGAYRIQQHKSSTFMDSRCVGRARIRLASSGKSTSFLCSPFCEVDEKMRPWKLLKVVVCVPQAVTRSLLFCGFGPESKTKGRDSIAHHREDRPSCNRDCLQGFCLSDLVGGWGLTTYPYSFKLHVSRISS